MQTIQFRSADTYCAADLYLPDDLKPGERRAAVVLGQGFTGLKEMLRQEAEYFCAAGFIALAIDYRTFGASGGEPRCQAFPLNEVEDVRNAVSYLETRDDVDASRIGLWATSFGGGIAIYSAAFDRRIKATVAQMPIVDGRHWMQALRTTEQYERLLERVEADRRRRFEGAPSERIKVMATFASGEFCAMPVDDEIFSFAQQSLSIAPNRREDVTLETVEKIIQWRPIDVVHLISPRPICIVAASGYDINHPLEPILQAYERAREPKRLHLIPCGQMDLYLEPTLRIGMGHALDWFRTYLRGERAVA